MFDGAYLVKELRDIRAAELAASIARPRRELAQIVIDANDQDALAIAIERSTPDQLAKWIIGLVTGAGAFEDDEDEGFDPEAG